MLLATHKGKPLDDEVLIEVLAESKKTSEIIKKKVVESEENEVKIDEIRALYKPVAVRASGTPDLPLSENFLIFFSTFLLYY